MRPNSLSDGQTYSLFAEYAVRGSLRGDNTGGREPVSYLKRSVMRSSNT